MKYIIDAGHRKGEGANANGINEGELVIKIRDELRKLLPDALYVPDNLTFPETLEFARKNVQADTIAISIHLNSNNNVYLNGTEAYYSDRRDLAEIFSETVAKRLGTINLGAKHEKYSYFGTLGFLHLPCPGVIVECGYISNKDDVEKIKNGIMSIALGIYDAIQKIEIDKKKISILRQLVGLLQKLLALQNKMKLGALSSTQNPEKLSLTVKSIAAGLLPVIHLITGIELVNEQVDKVIDAVFVLFTSYLAIRGYIRAKRNLGGVQN
ncbi:MAG: N-acetylmuramoyl-L-alanine amidase [Candidatus Pacebacteria bacterium]|nr:N-acetylmuramoyl-L-alanine amidase [Candidatus Paceibacterota bacterium]NUQ57510.1 N-acetylmuramoyl-L-alanine amidase [Candidatus Paceibacter sp.]